MGAAEFLNKEIKQLLKDGIIRPSRSPLNSPAWVVNKKGSEADGTKKKRLVIDLRKLNERTISDRNRMPSIPMILGNLGKSKFFTTLDLKSGYHQIYLAECDCEKTFFSLWAKKCRKHFPKGNRRRATRADRENLLRLCR